MSKIIFFNNETEKYELRQLKGLISGEEERAIRINSSLEYNKEIRELLTQYTRENSKNNVSGIDKLCKEVQLPYEFIREFEPNLRKFWGTILRTTIFTEDILEEYIEQIIPYWFIVIAYQKLTEEFLEQYMDIIESDSHFWSIISTSQQLSESFHLKYFDKIDWSKAIINNKLTNKVLTKVCRTFRISNWNDIVSNQELSSNFVEEFADLIDWTYAINKRKISLESQNKFKVLITSRSRVINKSRSFDLF